MAANAMDDLPDAWKKALQPHSELTAPTAPPATSSAPPASDAPAAPWGHDTATALVGGIYNAFGNVARNVAGYTPPALPADAQADIAAHPYAAGAGNVIGGVTATAPLLLAPSVGSGVIGGLTTGALTGALQNDLAGNPDESWGRRMLTGGLLGAGLGAAGAKIGSWFGAGRALDPDVAQAAQTAQSKGIDVGLPNLPGGNIKAMGATPTYAQAGQIDNAVSKILGDDVPNWNAANFGAVQGRIGGAISKAANSGSIDVNAPLSAGGPTVNDVLSQIRTAASAYPEVGAQINPLISRIQARVGPGGIISGKDFDNLVGNGSVLHDLVGSDNPYIKEAAQALDSTMDAGFRNTSGVDAYNNWVNARTGYRMLMGVKQAILPNGHINPTTLFNAVQNRFTDLKGTPLSANSVVGDMGNLAGSIRTLFGGGGAPPRGGSPGFWPTVAAGLGISSAPEIASAITSGNYASPETYLSPAGLAALAAGAGTVGARYLGNAWQQTGRFANELIGAGGRPLANPLMSPGAINAGVQAFPQRQTQP